MKKLLKDIVRGAGHYQSASRFTSMYSTRVARFSQKPQTSYDEAQQIFSNQLEFHKLDKPIPTFRVIDLKGDVIAPEYDTVPKEVLLKIYETMFKCEEMDSILYMAQRQGKISFYMTSFGETACVVGSAAALQDHDLMFPQYREQAAIMYRGFQIRDFVNQCMGNIHDLGKGRQMPVHYGSSKLNYVTISSPLATQIPQASGAGYGFRIANQDRIAATYFGEGTTSEGDFHAGLNFAATLQSQTLFLCRNNKYAISTSSADQFRGDAIAGRGPSYGIRTGRVDGNDALAVYHMVKEARKYIVENKAPALIEFMTYRIGDHSTSDHSVLYRDEQEINSWKMENNPLQRLGLYLKKKGWRDFDKKKDDELRKSYKEECIKALREGIEAPIHPMEELFNDVYDKLTPNLQRQKNELEEHLQKYSEHYERKH